MKAGWQLNKCDAVWLSALRQMIAKRVECAVPPRSSVGPIIIRPLLLLLLSSFANLAFSQLQLLPEKQSIALFGDGQREIATTWRNTNNTTAEIDVRLRLYQASSSTVIPLSDSPWKKLQVLPGQTILESAPVTFPRVRAETEFLIQWIANPSKVLGKTALHIFPNNLLTALKPLAGEEPLGIYDPGDQLKWLLHANAVPFADLELIGLDRFQGRIAILGPFESTMQMRDGFATEIKAMARKGIAVLWFKPAAERDEPLKPSFYLVQTRKGAVVVAQAQLAPDLTHNPRSQLNLLELARIALHPPSFHLSNADFSKMLLTQLTYESR